MAKCGKVTEVYSRCTGYHRPVKNWNPGKVSEFHDRKMYSVGGALARIKSTPSVLETDQVAVAG